MTDYFHDLDVLGEDEVLLILPSYNTPPSDSLEGDQEVETSGAAEEVMQDAPGLIWSGSYNKVLTDYRQQKEFVDFITSKMGMVGNFWCPSFVSDFTLYQSTIDPASRSLFVIPDSFSWVFEPNRYGVYVQTINDRFIWQIDGYDEVEGAAFDLLHTKSVLGKPIMKDEVLFVSLVRFARFNTDRFPMQMQTPKIGNVSYSFLELPEEARFVERSSIYLLNSLIDSTESLSTYLAFSPGWFDPTSDPSDNTGGDGRTLKTNQIGAYIEVQTGVGTHSLGILPDRHPYSLLNENGLPFKHKQPIWAYRSRPADLSSPWSEWTASREGLEVDYLEGYWVVRGLDPSIANRVQIKIASLDPFTNPGNRLTRFFEPGQSSLTNPITSLAWSSDQMTHGMFWAIQGILTNSTGVLTLISDSRPKLKVLVIGEDSTAGDVVLGSGSSFKLSDTSLDSRGAAISWPSVLVDLYETAQGAKVSLCDMSIPRMLLRGQSTNYRAGTTPSGLPSTVAGRDDLINCFDQVTNTRPLPDGWEPDIVIVSLSAFDQDVASNVDDTIAPGDTQADADSLWTAMNSLWPSTHILVVPFPRDDSELGDNPYTLDPVTVKEEIKDSVTVDHAADSWVELVDIDAVDPGTEVIFTEAQHETVAGIVYPYFEAAANAALGL